MLIENGFDLWNKKGGRTERQMDRNLKILLNSVSRTFALSLQTLPVKQKDFVGVCYLVARVADTISDSGGWPASLRARLLKSWHQAIQLDHRFQLKESVGTFSEREARLLLDSDKILALYRGLASGDWRVFADEVFETLFSGMQRLVQARASYDGSKIVQPHLRADEFDWYCYTHAGCVGRFWNQIFELPVDLEQMAILYGKALERVNIFRDLKEDWDQGLLLLDHEGMKEFDLNASRPPWLQPGWRSFSESYLSKTRSMLLSGANYCDSIPYLRFRLRLASQMPFRLGWQSLDFYGQDPVGQVDQSKIDRRIVKREFRSAVCSLWRKSNLTRTHQKKRLSG
ncbi:MAG: hypothetical protein EA369_09275 [Bradymonadales bacterium]|nr:MAG: hypothetical protein EA369_09275 [Bradymonadales bacterium]